MKEKIGVYICHCGGNISDYVNVEELSKMFHEEDNVVVSKDVMFACADSNQKDMIKDIQEFGLDSIVVCSCSPKLHLHTFKNVAERAGLNPSNYVQVNIREQCSWAHSDQPHEATVKAAGLIRAGINRVSYSESLEPIDISVKNTALVVGAGVAGMKAAIDMARSGTEVFIIEKDYFVGGRVAQKETLFPTETNAKQLVTSLYQEMKKYNNISLFAGASIEKVSGSLGNFTVDVKVKPRYLSPNADPKLVRQAMDECTVSVPDPFYFGYQKRKAIFKNYPDAWPDVPVVLPELLENETDFKEKFKSVFNFNEQEQTLSLVVGSVLVTTGFNHYEPKEGEFGYKTIDNVITLPELNTLMEMNPKQLIYKNKVVKDIAFIYCVGSRQSKGENKYCSRQCCTSTIHASLQLKEKYKDIQTYHLYRDIRTYGKQELMYEASSKQGDLYFKYEEKEMPVVEKVGNSTIVKVKDYLTAKMPLEIEADLVVLVTGMVPREDSAQISEFLKIPIGSDRFFNEIHPKLKPVETVIKGVYIGGACQGPKNISESVQSSMSGASKIVALLKRGTVSVDPIIARVNTDLCTWCGKCAEVCDYTAIKEMEVDGKRVAGVNKAVCTGCGICAPVCPVNAIEIAQYTDHEIESMIDGFLAEVDIKEGEVVQNDQHEEEETTGMKEYPQIWKEILAGIRERNTIPEIIQNTGINGDLVTYHLMTMNKYGIVTPDGLDAKEEYYYYKVKN